MVRYGSGGWSDGESGGWSDGGSGGWSDMGPEDGPTVSSVDCPTSKCPISEGPYKGLAGIFSSRPNGGYR